MIKKFGHHICMALSMSAMLLTATVWGEVVVKVSTSGKEASIAPLGWLAPYSVIAASPSGEKLTSFDFDLKGIDIKEIKEAAVFLSKNIAYSSSLVHFPNDWALKPCSLKADASGKITAILNKTLNIPAKITPQIDFIIGFKLAKNVKNKQFSVTLGKLVFSSSKVTPENSAIICKLDNTAPKITISSEKIARGDGINGVKLKVTSDSTLAFPPHVSIDYPWKKDIRNYHTYPAYKYSTPMTKESDNVYTLPVLYFERLSDNLAKEKKVTYTCHPAPDQYKHRKDDTGHDLIDGDARDIFIAAPGGLRWMFTNNVEVTVDLKASAMIGEVVCYTRAGSESVSVSVAEKNDGPWSKPVEKNINLFPLKQLGPKYAPMRASVILDPMPKGRFVKLKFQCNKSLIISELVVYGVKDGKHILKPKLFDFHAWDEVGNKTNIKYKIK